MDFSFGRPRHDLWAVCEPEWAATVRQCVCQPHRISELHGDGALAGPCDLRFGDSQRSVGGFDQQGRTVQKEIAGIEVEVKDTRRFTSTKGWGFFEFGAGHEPAVQLDKSQTCYSCHPANGAVEQTFVQFYPTLVPVATTHGTLNTKTGADK